MSSSNLSRIENNKIMVSDENQRFLKEKYGIDFSMKDSDLQSIDEYASKIIHLYIFYKLFTGYTKEELDNEKVNYENSIAYPYYMLIKFFVYTLKDVDKKFVSKYLKIYEELIHLFPPKYQKIYHCAKLYYLFSLSNYSVVLSYCEFIEENDSTDYLLDSYVYHVKSVAYGCLGDLENQDKTLEKTIELSEKTDNHIRKLSLQTTRANIMRQKKEYKKALAYDRLNLQFAKQQGIHFSDFTILYNMGWTYYLMKEYKNAIKYFKLAEQVDVDDDLCFTTAYCYFKLSIDTKSFTKMSEYRKQCKDYLDKAKTARKTCDAFMYLVSYLELMMNKRYSKKAEQKLLECLKRYKNTLHIDSKRTIYNLLIEHYMYHHDDKNIKYYREQLDLL